MIDILSTNAIFKLLLSTCCDQCKVMYLVALRKRPLVVLYEPPCLRIYFFSLFFFNFFYKVCVSADYINSILILNIFPLDAQLSWMICYVVYYLLLPLISLPVPSDP